MASSAKPRQPRLRASCDGCFIAKVKCSKARPICSRCLACGLECRYSPSSRAGKPKSDGTLTAPHGSPSHQHMGPLNGIPDDKQMAYQNHAATPLGLYKLETGWHTPPNLDASLNPNPSMNPGFGVLDPNQHNPNVGMDMYGVGAGSWVSSAEIPSTAFVDMSMAAAQLQPGHGRSASMDAGMQMPLVSPWMDAVAAGTPTNNEMMAYDTPTSLPTPASMGSNYFPSPSVTPNVPHRHRPGSVGAAVAVGPANACNCFTLCLQSLQALHNASTPNPPPFDVVLSLNRTAVEGCATMLACPRCMNRSGTHTAAMLLATLMGKITNFYKSSSQVYFENPVAAPTDATHTLPGSKGNSSPNSTLGITLGAYTLGGEDGRWLELEILNRELRKLEEVYSQFREVFTELSDDPAVGDAMIGYLNHTLGTTLEVVKHRQGRMQFS